MPNFYGRIITEGIQVLLIDEEFERTTLIILAT
jgi:hypothetical protein